MHLANQISEVNNSWQTEAVQHLQDSITIYRAIGNKQDITITLDNFGLLIEDKIRIPFHHISQTSS
jgi:hypothetical protein